MEKSAILSALATEVKQGRLFFSTSVNAAIHIKNKLEDPDCNLDSAIHLIKAEPLLAAKVVGIANSVIFNRTGKEITDIRSAMTSIGMRTVRSLATAIVVQQLSGPQQKKSMVVELWQHSVHVAALARIIAQHITKQNPDTALFAGIIHEISWFYLLSREKHFPGLMDESVATAWASDEDLKNESELECEIQIGSAILQALSVPPPVLEGIICLWKGHLSSPPTALGDTLLFANQLASVKSPLTLTSNQTRDDIMYRLHSLIDEQALQDLLKESEHEVKSLTKALNS